MIIENKLIGKKIKGYTLSADQTELMIQLDGIHYLVNDEIKLRVDGDCCSESWIETVDAPKFPCTILSVEEKDLGAAPATRQEYDVKYSTILKTDKGDFEIIYRNSSNGYYGGSIEVVG